MAFTDELWSGVAVVGAPAVEREFDIDHAVYTSAVFVLPTLLAAAIEAGLMLLMDRVDRRVFLWLGLAMLAASLGASALAPSAWWLSLGLASAGAASGAACGAAQAELIAREGDGERAMVRWTLFANFGDLLVPLVVAGSLAMRASYRDALYMVMAFVALQLVACVLSRPASSVDPAAADTEPEETSVAAATSELDDEDASEPFFASLRHALGHRELLMCLLGASMCSLLDELAAAMAALRARIDLGASESAASAGLVAFSIGAIAGTVVTERLLATRSSQRILLGSSALAVLGLAGVVLAPDPIALACGLAVVGFAASAHYPILRARAYACVPGRPGLANAVGQIFVVIDLGAPLVLGLVAERWGVGAALACLVLQPIVVACLALGRGRSP